MFLLPPMGMETSPTDVPVRGLHGFTVTSCFIMPVPLLVPPILPIGLPVPRCWGWGFFGIIVMAELFLNGRTLLTFATLAVRFTAVMLLSEKMDKYINPVWMPYNLKPQHIIHIQKYHHDTHNQLLI